MPNGRQDRRYRERAHEDVERLSQDELMVTILASLFWLEDTVQAHVERQTISHNVRVALLSAAAAFVATGSAWYVLLAVLEVGK